MGTQNRPFAGFLRSIPRRIWRVLGAATQSLLFKCRAHGEYTEKTDALTDHRKAIRSGGAGGIRTHEWRFCRPLPWATWVPRRSFKYSKSAWTLRTTPHNIDAASLY